MTFFFRVSLAGLLATAACNNPEVIPPRDGGGMDGPITFDAGDGGGTDGTGSDGAIDAPFDAFCGTVGCVTAGACTPTGTVTTLDTSSMHTAAGAAASVDGSGYLAAFDGFRNDGINVATRPISAAGAPGTESVVTSTFLFARHPSVAFAGTSGMVVYDTNDPPPTQIVARPLLASGAGTGTATPLTSGLGMSPHAASVAGLGATSFVAAWLDATETSPGVPGPAHAMVAELATSGAIVGTPVMVAAAGGSGITTLALATGDTPPALVTVENDATGTQAVRVRTIAADGTPATTALDVVTARAVNGGVTGARVGTGTLVAWGETVGGTSRQEVHLAFVDDTGTVMPEHIVTLLTDTGSDPRLVHVAAGIVLAYRGGPPGSRGVRAVGVNAFGFVAAAITTVLDGAEDPAVLSIAAIDASSVLFVLSDLTADGSGSRVRAVTANCTGT